jgi:hypothetical protein
MPRLVRGGKYVFGWSLVGDDGSLRIPEEALVEYGFVSGDRLVLMPGSRTSRGFSVSSLGKLRDSPFYDLVVRSPLMGAGVGEVVDVSGRCFCWVRLESGVICVPPDALRRYGVSVGDRVLAARGSRLGIGFPVTGPIIEEAKKHDIECFSV